MKIITVHKIIPQHNYINAELIKRDTENPLSVLDIANNMHIETAKSNNCNISFYDEQDNIVGFVYGEMLSKQVVRTKYLWFKNAKYAIIIISIFLIVTDCRVWYPDVVFQSSKWYKMYSIFLNKKADKHLAKYIFTDEDIKVKVVDILRKLHTSYTGENSLEWVM